MKQGLLVVSDLLAFALTPSLHTQAASLDTSFSTEFAEQGFMAYTVNGEATGLYQNAGTFSYLRVHGADTKFLPTRGCGAANVHVDHVRPAAVKHMMYNACIKLYVRLEAYGPREWV